MPSPAKSAGAGLPPRPVAKFTAADQSDSAPAVAKKRKVYDVSPSSPPRTRLSRSFALAAPNEYEPPPGAAIQAMLYAVWIGITLGLVLILTGGLG